VFAATDHPRYVHDPTRHHADGAASQFTHTVIYPDTLDHWSFCGRSLGEVSGGSCTLGQRLGR